jgi:hypothetical protein
MPHSNRPDAERLPPRKATARAEITLVDPPTARPPESDTGESAAGINTTHRRTTTELDLEGVLRNHAVTEGFSGMAGMLE